MFEKDETFYDVLGIDPTASSKEIKESYLELSKKHHPDVNPGNPDAAAKFHTVSQAYATLSQGKLRRMYDRGNLGRMSSVADRESATHSFDGSGFVEGRKNFQEKMNSRTRSKIGQRTKDEMDLKVKNITTELFQQARIQNLRKDGRNSVADRRTTGLHNNKHEFSSRETRSGSGSGLFLVILVVFVSIVLKLILS